MAPSRRLTALAPAVLALAPTVAQAQDLEPRAYSNAPVGLNFLIAGYAYSTGGLSTDPTVPLQDAQLKIHTTVVAYARTLDLWGRSGKFDAILPYSELSGTALVAGQPRDRNIGGFLDPRFRLSLNLYGAPALSAKDFAGYQHDLVVGTSVQVSAPAGQYDPTRAINLGTHRWSVKPDIGLSKAFGDVTADVSAGVTFYTRNDDYFGGKTLDQDRIYSVQTNLSYNFDPGTWLALGATFYRGGRTTVDGVRNNDMLNNARAGLTLALPVDRYNSIKINASRGVTTRIGTSFDTVGVAWQHRWGAGF